MAVALRDARRHDVLDAERLEAALLLDGARRPRHADARLQDGDGVVVALGLDGTLLAVGAAARRLDALHVDAPRDAALRGALLDDDVALGAARRRLDAVRVERLLLAAALLGVGVLHLGVGALRLDAMRVDALLGIGAAIIGAAGVGVGAARLRDGLRLASGEYLAGGLMAARRRRDVVDDGLDGHVVVVGRRHDALRDERLRRLLDEGQDRRRGHERRDGRRGDDRPR